MLSEEKKRELRARVTASGKGTSTPVDKSEEKAKFQARLKEIKAAALKKKEEAEKIAKAEKARLAANAASDKKARMEELRKNNDAMQAINAARKGISAAFKPTAVDTDENGTPAVGGAPDSGPATPAAPVATDPNASADPAPNTPPVTDPNAPADPAKKESDTLEDSASVLVKVNEKIAEIEKREMVDKELKAELTDIKEALTSTAKRIRAAASIPPAPPAPATPAFKILSQKEIVSITTFLAKVDDYMKNRVAGFESTAAITRDTDRFREIVASVRSELDISSEKAHHVMDAYLSKKADADAVKEATRVVKAAVEKFNVLDQAVAVFKNEASGTTRDLAHLKSVAAHVQKMVDDGVLPPARIGAQFVNFLGLSPIEFKSVAATLSVTASASGDTPSAVPGVLTGKFYNSDTLEDIFGG